MKSCAAFGAGRRGGRSILNTSCRGRRRLSKGKLGRKAHLKVFLIRRQLQLTVTLSWLGLHDAPAAVGVADICPSKSTETDASEAIPSAERNPRFDWRR